MLNCYSEYIYSIYSWYTKCFWSLWIVQASGSKRNMIVAKILMLNPQNVDTETSV